MACFNLPKGLWDEWKKPECRKEIVAAIDRDVRRPTESGSYRFSYRGNSYFVGYEKTPGTLWSDEPQPAP